MTLLASAAEWEGEDLMCDWRMVAVRRNGSAMRFEQQEQQGGRPSGVDVEPSGSKAMCTKAAAVWRWMV